MPPDDEPPPGFEAVEPLPPGFEAVEPEAEAPVAQPVQQTKPVQQPSQAEALARGAGETASFSLGDEMAALGGVIAGGAPRTVGRGMNAPLADSTEETARRAEESRRAHLEGDQRAQAAHPKMYTTGQVAGALATAAAAPSGGGLARGAGVLAAEGVLTGLGASEGETAAERGTDAATGAGASVVTGGLLKGAGKLLPSADRLRKVADNRRLAQAGITNKVADNAPGGREAMVGRLRKNKIVGGLYGRSKIAERAKEFVDKANVERDAAIPADAHIPGERVAKPLRAKARQIGGADAVDAERTRMRQEAAVAARKAAFEADQLRAQQKALGLDQKFRPRDPAERMAAPPPPMAQSPTVQAPATPGTQRIRNRVPGLPDDATPTKLVEGDPTKVMSVAPPAPAPQTQHPMAGPKNARRMAKHISAADARAAELQGKITPDMGIKDPATGRAERRLIGQEADSFEPRGQVPLRVLDQSRKRWGDLANPSPGADSSQVRAFGEMHGVANDLLESEINRVNPGAGSRWRDLGLDQQAAIAAREGAEGSVNKQDQAAVGLRRGLAGIVAGPAGVAADVAASGGRGHAAVALGAEGAVAASKSRLGRMLRRATPDAAARLSALGALPPEEAAREHFLQSETAPGGLYVE